MARKLIDLQALDAALVQLKAKSDKEYIRQECNVLYIDSATMKADFTKSTFEDLTDVRKLLVAQDQDFLGKNLANLRIRKSMTSAFSPTYYKNDVSYCEIGGIYKSGSNFYFMAVKVPLLSSAGSEITAKEYTFTAAMEEVSS